MNKRSLSAASSALALMIAQPCSGQGVDAVARGLGAVAYGRTTVPTFPTLSGQINHRNGPLRIIGRNHGNNGTAGTVGTDFSATGRVSYTTGGAVSTVEPCFGQRGSVSSGNEAGTAPAQIVRAAIQLQGGAVQPFMAPNGGRDLIIPADTIGPIACMQPLGIPIPANTQFWISNFQRVPQYPSSPAATVTTLTLGNLAASTTYYYKFTSVDTGLESGPTAEQSCTTGALGALACNLSWTPNTYASATNIYRSTTTGAEKFLTQIPASQSSFTDVGLITPNASVSPPAQIALVFQRYPRTGDSGNAQYAGGNGSDQTLVSGTVLPQTNNQSNFIPTPTIVLGDDTSVPTVCGMGDSIEFGVGIGSEGGQYSAWFSNWFDQGWPDGQLNSNNFSIGGTQLNQVMGTGTTAWGRWAQSFPCDYLVSDLSVNDLGVQTWQQIAANQIALGKILFGRGIRHIITTLTPLVTTTDNVLTVVNQTAGPYESTRTNYNNWVRNGMQVSGGVPCNTVGCGTRTPYIWNYFDLAAPVEVNASNVPTPNGGYWIANFLPSYTGTASGTPTLTSLPCVTCNFPLAGGASSGIATYVVKFTSGVQSGNTAMIKTSTATSLTLYTSGDLSLSGKPVEGLTGTAPSAG